MCDILLAPHPEVLPLSFCTVRGVYEWCGWMKWGMKTTSPATHLLLVPVCPKITGEKKGK